MHRVREVLSKIFEERMFDIFLFFAQQPIRVSGSMREDMHTLVLIYDFQACFLKGEMIEIVK